MRTLRTRSRPLTSGSFLLPVLLLCSFLFGGCPATRVERTVVVKGGTGTTESERETLRRTYTQPELPSQRRLLLREAESWIGTPYRYAGTARDGVDCSGFVCTIFSILPHKLPRNSASQATVGEAITLRDAEAGDLVFFNTLGSGVSHVGIYIADNLFIHASTTIGVTINSLSEEYYRKRFVSVRRVLP